MNGGDLLKCRSKQERDWIGDYKRTFSFNKGTQANDTYYREDPNKVYRGEDIFLLFWKKKIYYETILRKKNKKNLMIYTVEHSWIKRSQSEEINIF